MGNTNMDFLYPEFWAGAFDELDIGEYGLQNLVSRDVEAKLANAGDVVNVPLTPDLGDADDWVPGATITATDVAQEKYNVTLDKSKKKTIQLNGTELSLSAYDLIQKYGVPMAKSIMRAVNLDIYKALMKTDYLVDATASFDEDTIVDIGTLLSQNEISEVGRILVAGPTAMGKMKKFDAFQHVNIAGNDDVITNGFLARKFGFDIFGQHIISKYTPADLTGAVNLLAGYNIGDLAMVVDAFNDDANPVREGDVFKITGETGAPFHVVTGTTKTGGDTTALSYLVGNVDAVANDTVVTVTPTESVIGFVPSAIAFAARTYNQLPDGVGAKQATMMLRGIPVRISVWHDGNLGIKVQYDVLYGVSVANKKRISRALVA